MRGVVVVPCWRRPDFLWATLECITRADDWRHQHYLIAIDREADAAVREVAESWQGQYEAVVSLWSPGPHHFNGNSFNVLRAYQRAVELAAITHRELVYLIEEDIFIGKGFFRFHNAAHALVPAAFGVSACRDQNHPPRVGSLRDVFLADTYQSLGVSFRLETVRRFTGVAEGAVLDYYTRPVEYLARRFPNSTIPRGQAEQDGLIGRVLEHDASTGATDGMVYPVLPRACHVGFAGYNRQGGQMLLGGTAEERGRALLVMSTDEMNRRADPSYRDIERCDLDAPEPDGLEIMPR